MWDNEAEVPSYKFLISPRPPRAYHKAPSTLPITQVIAVPLNDDQRLKAAEPELIKEEIIKENIEIHVELETIPANKCLPQYKLVKSNLFTVDTCDGTIRPKRYFFCCHLILTYFFQYYKCNNYCIIALLI